MKIEIIDQATIKVELTVKEVNAHQLSSGKMDNNDTATRRFLMDVLEQVEWETDLDLTTNKRWSVEIWESDEGEMILYLNCTQGNFQSAAKKAPKKTKAKPIRSCESDVLYIFSFSTLDALCKACFRLQNQFSHISIESKLYYTQDKYQLIILSNRSPEKQLLQMLQEYGQLCGKSNIAMAWIQEHGKELIAQGAVVEIAKLG